MADGGKALFPKITEKGLDDLRSRIGIKIADTVEPWNYEATRDAIRHYAHGIGDDNPLWCEPDYAAKSRFGSIVALAELPVYHEPYRIRLRRRPLGCTRHVGRCGLDMACAGIAQ